MRFIGKLFLLLILNILFSGMVYGITLQVASRHLEKGEDVKSSILKDVNIKKLIDRGFCLKVFGNKQGVYKVLVDVDESNLKKFKREYPNAFRVNENDLLKGDFSLLDKFGNCNSTNSNGTNTTNLEMTKVSVSNSSTGNSTTGRSIATGKKSLESVMNVLESFSVKGDSIYLYGKAVWEYAELESLQNSFRVILKLFNTKYLDRLNDVLFPLPYVDRLRILYDEKNRYTMVVFYLSAPMRVNTEKDGRVIKVSFVPDGLGVNNVKVVGKGKVSFDLRKADIGDVLRIFSEITGINFVVDPEVNGTVTMRMVQVDAMKALDAILKSLSLVKVEYDTNIYRITTLDKLSKELEKEDETSPVITKVFKFKNISVSALESEGTCGILSESKNISASTTLGGTTTAKAGNEEDKCRDLRDMFKVLLSSKGKMEIVQAINGIVVTDRKSRLDIIEKIIKEIDAPKPQVQINARMVEVSSNYARELGIQWGFLWRQSKTGINFPHFFEVGGVISNSTLGRVSTRLPVGFVVDLPANVGKGRGATIAATLLNRSETFGIDVRLSALEDRGLAKTISSPRIITSDNSPAVIVQGFQVPYKIATQYTVATQFVVAALRLKVIPHVTDDGAVLTEIVVSKDSPDFTNITPDGVPIKVREVKTRVKVRQGETLVIGGIYEISSGSSTNSVPGVNRVPLLKWLFTHEVETADKTEVLVFITPTVLRGLNY